MSKFFETDVDKDGIATISWLMVDHPMNVLSTPALQEFGGLWLEYVANDSIKGIVVTSSRDKFIVGADINDLAVMQKLSAEGIYASTMRLHEFLRLIEKEAKPTVVAINGDALGGGFEFALAFRYRLMSDKDGVKLGLPEVMLGLLPGGGGTQRLPRILGPREALPYLTTGKSMRADKAKKFGVVHEVVPHDKLLDAAKAAILEKKVPAKAPWDEKDFVFPGGPAHSGDWLETFGGANAMLRRETHGNYPAPKRIIAAVYQGLQLHIDKALAFELRQFTSLMLSDESRNLIRTGWFGRNAANKLEKRPKDIPATEFTKVGVIGAGVMGAGIASCTAQGGCDVVLLDVNQEAADRGKQHVVDYFARQVSKRRLTQEEADKIVARVTATTDYSALEGAQLTIEAVFENREIKAKVTKATEAVTDAKHVFGTNTSTLPITGLAEASERPDEFIGIHFFSPVEKMPLVEIIRGEKTSDHAAAVAMDYVKLISKTPIVVNDSRGFYTSRVFGTYTREAFTMLMDGVSPAVIENVGKATGMPMGPLELVDMIGIDTAHKITHATIDEVGKDEMIARGEPMDSLEVIDWIVEECERYGQKIGKGFYDYGPDNKKTQIWPEVYNRFPTKNSPLDVDDLKKRFLHIQALETMRCMEEGVVMAADDADVGSIFGWGFAPFHGGVISYAETIGLPKFLAECEDLAERYGKRFEPPQLLRDMVAKGECFYPDEKRPPQAAE
ncbi:MAG: 3-hydroxyacyl-CoA dehydrogenase NAD-binding domain-containing protein [Pseudomonadota bacterium]